MTISTSVGGAQHPNAGQNIQQTCQYNNICFFCRDQTLGAGVTDPSSNAPNTKLVLENQEGCGFRGSEGTRSEIRFFICGLMT